MVFAIPHNFLWLGKTFMTCQSWKLSWPSLLVSLHTKEAFNFYMTKKVYLYIVVVFYLSCATKFTNPWKLMNFLLNQQLQGGNSVSYVKDSRKCKNFKKDFLIVNKALTPSCWRSLPYRNQSNALQSNGQVSV